MSKNAIIIVSVVGALVFCCGGSAMALLVLGAASSDGAAGSKGTGGPAPLVGRWMFGSVSMVEYRNVLTGEFAPPSGQGQSYELREDGRCVQSAMIQASTGIACTSFIFTYTGEDGCSWSADDSTLTIELDEGTMRSRMCSGAVKEGTSKARTVKSRYRLEQEGQFTWLVLTDESGDFRYRREE